jgi:hypothetical protein
MTDRQNLPGYEDFDFSCVFDSPDPALTLQSMMDSGVSPSSILSGPTLGLSLGLGGVGSPTNSLLASPLSASMGTTIISRSVTEADRRDEVQLTLPSKRGRSSKSSKPKISYAKSSNQSFCKSTGNSTLQLQKNSPTKRKSAPLLSGVQSETVSKKRQLSKRPKHFFPEDRNDGIPSSGEVPSKNSSSIDFASTKVNVDLKSAKQNPSSKRRASVNASPLNASKLMDQHQRRIMHNDSEKRRQHKITEHIDQLQHTMESFLDKPVPRGKANVLEASVDFMKSLIRDNKILSEQVLDLQVALGKKTGKTTGKATGKTT